MLLKCAGSFLVLLPLFVFAQLPIPDPELQAADTVRGPRCIVSAKRNNQSCRPLHVFSGPDPSGTTLWGTSGADSLPRRESNESEMARGFGHSGALDPGLACVRSGGAGRAGRGAVAIPGRPGQSVQVRKDRGRCVLRNGRARW